MKRKIRKAVVQFAFFVYNRISGIFIRLDCKKAIFASEAGEEIKGNLKAVYDRVPEGFEKVVHVKGDRRNRSGLKETLALWRDLTTSKYIFLDDFYGLISVMKPRKDQEIIQLWHGSGAYKKFGFSRIGTGDNITSVHKGYRKYTKVPVTSEPVRPCFAEAFDIDVNKVKALGSPRTDIFFDESAKEQSRQRVYRRYPGLRDKKVVLIAPTYRGKKVEDAAYDFDKLNLNRITDGLGDEYEVITRWHPALYNNIKRGIRRVEEADVTDMSEYPEINDLLIIADILVTDYSSVIFDWYLLDKPIVYFAYDMEEYRMNRGLYFDFEEYVYGRIAKDCDALIEAIKTEEFCSELRTAFGNKFMSSCDGKSTDRIIEWVFGGDGVDGSNRTEKLD